MSFLRSECDLYGGNGIRNKSWTYAQYDVEWTAYAAAIAAGVPSAPKKLFQGATVAGRGWYPDLTAYATEHQAVLATVSVHAYPTTHCSGRNVTITQLLADAAVNDSTQLTAHHLPANMAALGIPLQLGEGNSASCGGFPGVSNVFASALWAIDDLYDLASVGLKGFNFHGGGSSQDSYSALVWASAAAQQPVVQPLFYGLLMFAMGTRNNARIIPSPPAESTNNLIKLHSTWDGQRMAVMVVHKDSTRNATTERATVILAFPAPTTFTFPVAALRRLEAANITERWNITLAGRTFQGTKDGSILGLEVVEAVKPMRLEGSGQYQFTVKPASAVLFEWEVSAEEAAKLTMPTAMSYVRDV